MSVYGPVSEVTGIESCTFNFGPTTFDGGAQHSRNGTATCTDATNDARVSGQYTATWNIDYWGRSDRQRGALVQWGTTRLTNAGGTWEGRATGVWSSDRGDVIVTWWTGTGGYAGLAYFQIATGGGPWTINGQIFPGYPPSP